MADIDIVLERLVTDPVFRRRLSTDAGAALAGYELDADDLALLTRSLDGGTGVPHGVEQRASKSAVLGLLASLSGGGADRGGGYNEIVTDDTPGTEAPPAAGGTGLTGDGGDTGLGHALGLRHEHVRPESGADTDFLTVEDA